MCMKYTCPIKAVPSLLLRVGWRLQPPHLWNAIAVLHCFTGPGLHNCINILPNPAAKTKEFVIILQL